MDQWTSGRMDKWKKAHLEPRRLWPLIVDEPMKRPQLIRRAIPLQEIPPGAGASKYCARAGAQPRVGHRRVVRVQHPFEVACPAADLARDPRQSVAAAHRRLFPRRRRPLVERLWKRK